MDNRVKWILIAAVLIGVVLVCCLLLALVALNVGLFDTGPDYHGPGMQRDRDSWPEVCPGCGGLSVGNVLLLLLALTVPLGLVILAGLGIFWLARSRRQGGE